MSRRTFDLLLLPQAVSASAQQTIAIRAMLYGRVPGIQQPHTRSARGSHIYEPQSSSHLCDHRCSSPNCRTRIVTGQVLRHCRIQGEIGLLWPLFLHLPSGIAALSSFHTLSRLPCHRTLLLQCHIFSVNDLFFKAATATSPARNAFEGSRGIGGTFFKTGACSRE